MPLETFSGPDVPALLAQARSAMGADAVVLAVRRVGSGRRPGFELIAADPATAGTTPRLAGLPRPLAPSVRPAARPPSPAPRGEVGPAVIVLVGPTGAGKTTTIAKLANHPKAFGGSAVGLLCLDTYRVGAVEQSRIYADLSRLPLEVVYETGEIPGALRRLRDREVVLVDTAGRGPRGSRDRAMLEEQLRLLQPFQVHLTLPAGLRPHLARRVVGDYRPLGVTHLLPTKLDEFPEDECAFALAAEYGLAMKWLTDGQEVPADLRPVPSLDRDETDVRSLRFRLEAAGIA
jgi:hypothetical protein